jgi:hypothetical protein
MKQITTTAEVESINDIDADWKIVARQIAPGIWQYCGALDETRERILFRSMAFPEKHGEQPHISVVTGRSVAGQCVLYARIFPMAARAVERRW